MIPNTEEEDEDKQAHSNALLACNAMGRHALDRVIYHTEQRGGVNDLCVVCVFFFLLVAYRI